MSQKTVSASQSPVKASPYPRSPVPTKELKSRIRDSNVALKIIEVDTNGNVAESPEIILIDSDSDDDFVNVDLPVPEVLPISFIVFHMIPHKYLLSLFPTLFDLIKVSNLQVFDPHRTRAIEEGAFKWFSMDRAINVLDTFSREVAPPTMKVSQTSCSHLTIYPVSHA